MLDTVNFSHIHRFKTPLTTMLGVLQLMVALIVSSQAQDAVVDPLPPPASCSAVKGSFGSTVKHLDQGKTSHGSKVKVTCSRDYVLDIDDTKTSQVSTCDNGKWTPPIPKCDACINKKVDLYLILDLSKSIDSRELKRTKELIRELIRKFPINSESGFRIGIICYSNVAKENLGFVDIKSASDFQTLDFCPRQLPSYKRHPGSYTDLGMKKALEGFKQNSREGATKVAVIFTDGVHSSSPRAARTAQKLEKAGIHVVAVCLHNDCCKQGLNDIATGTRDENVILAKAFRLFWKMPNSIAHEVCVGPTRKSNRKMCDYNTAHYLRRGVAEGYTHAGDSVFYKCDPGFEIEGGAKSSRCKKDGTWSQTQPKCIKVKRCADLTGTHGGKIDYLTEDITREGGKVKFTCKQGYLMNGSPRPTRTCTCKNGVWDPPIPTCYYARCDAITKIDHGVVRSQDTTPTRCVRFECDPGYKLVGLGTKDFLTCVNRRWKPARETVKCVEKKGCTKFRMVKFGSISYENNDDGWPKKATLTCPNGYRLGSVSEWSCGENNKWSPTGQQPMCEVERCTWLPYLRHGTISRTTSQTTNGQTTNSEDAPTQMTFSCDEGYQLNNTTLQTVNCVNGKWDKDIPRCIEKTKCPVLQWAFLSQYEGYSREIGAVVTVKCFAGYKLKDEYNGDATFTCRQDGTWTRIPRCEKIFPAPVGGRAAKCRTFNDLHNGKCIESGQTELRSGTVTCTCNTGYVMKGASTAECVKQRWSETPVCRKLQCKHLSELWGGTAEVEGFHIDATATFKCVDGYTAKEGEASIKCIQNGDKAEWTGKPLNCRHARCPNIRHIRHGKVIGTDDTEQATRIFECDDGYKLVGQETLTCIEVSGRSEWNGVFPECKINRCHPYQYVSNGRIHGNNYDVGAELDITCEPGYQLTSASKMKCQADLTWDQKPSCKYGLCTNFRKFFRGQVKNYNPRPDKEVTLVCNDGYKLVGPKRSRCNGTTLQWSPRLSKSNCMPITLCRSTKLTNGYVDYSGHSVHDRIYYSCQNGHYLLGYCYGICRPDGTWSIDKPNCVPKVAPVCRHRGQYLFLIADSSSYAGAGNHKLINDFATQMIEQYKVDPSYTRVGALQYSKECKWIVKPDDKLTKNKLLGMNLFKRDRDVYRTNLYKCIKEVHNYMSTSERPDFDITIVTLSYKTVSYPSADNVKGAIQNMKDTYQKLKMCLVSVTDRYEDGERALLADPRCIFKVAKFTDLNLSLSRRVTEESCTRY